MSQRESGYQRKPLDQYETPGWVTLALIPHLPEFIGKIWEPACGKWQDGRGATASWYAFYAMLRMLLAAVVAAAFRL